MSNDRSPAELESDFEAVARVASRGGPQATALTTLFHIGEEDLVVLEGSGDKPETVHRLDLGAARIAGRFFRHDPPTSQESDGRSSSVAHFIITARLHARRAGS